MEQQIKNQRKKLVISFSGCTKKDEGDGKKDNSSDRINTNKEGHRIRSYNDHHNHQLFYRLEVFDKLCQAFKKV